MLPNNSRKLSKNRRTIFFPKLVFLHAGPYSKTSRPIPLPTWPKKMKISEQIIKIDGIDKIILKLLIEDARTPIVIISKATGISGAAVHQRLKKMEKAEVISKKNPSAFVIGSDQTAEFKNKEVRKPLHLQITVAVELTLMI